MSFIVHLVVYLLFAALAVVAIILGYRHGEPGRKERQQPPSSVCPWGEDGEDNIWDWDPSIGALLFSLIGSLIISLGWAALLIWGGTFQWLFESHLGALVVFPPSLYFLALDYDVIDGPMIFKTVAAAIVGWLLGYIIWPLFVLLVVGYLICCGWIDWVLARVHYRKASAVS